MLWYVMQIRKFSVTLCQQLNNRTNSMLALLFVISRDGWDGCLNFRFEKMTQVQFGFV